MALKRSHFDLRSAMNMSMGSRSVRKLHDMDIDEVSLVDRAANQHATIAFSKADNQEENMPEDGVFDVYDVDGFPVDQSTLTVGDIVYNDEGEEFVVAESDGEEFEAYGDEPDFDSNFVSDVEEGHEMAIGKSLGDAMLEELSKASSEEERSEIIAAAMHEVEVAKAAAAEAWEIARHEQDRRLEDQFISKAAEYNLPVSPEVLGPILKSAATVLTDEQLDVLDQLFSAVGEFLYEELGAVGDTDNDDVMNQVDHYASELVGKSDGGLSPEQATTMMFANNPTAYEQYLAENGR